MKKTLTFLMLLCVITFGFSQDYFINEDFTKEKVKFKIPFEPDWDKDFFIETEVKIAVTNTVSEENAGIIFGYDNSGEKEKFYALYIQNASANEKKAIDYFKFRAYNVPFYENNEVWQNTSVINHEGYNRLQIYKIDNEAFFSINDQVIYHIKDIQTKGDQFQLVTGKNGINCNYIHAYYLDKSKSVVLKTDLISQFQNYINTGIHHKIANEYSKVLKLKQPVKIAPYSSNVSNYFPEIDAIIIANDNISFESNVIYYDTKTGETLSEVEIKTRLKKVEIYNEGFNTVHLNNSTETLEKIRFIGRLQGSLIL